MKAPTRGSSLGHWIVAFGLLVVLVTWLIVATVIHSDRRLEIERAGQETANLSKILKEHISGTFAQIEGALFSLRRNWQAGAEPAEMHLLLSHFVASRADLFNLISIIDAQGHVVVTNQDAGKATYSGDRPFFTHHRETPETEMHIGGPILGRVTGKWYLPVSLRLQDSHGAFGGVLLASINPDYFSQLFREVHLGKESLIFLADRRGTLYSGIHGGQELRLNIRIPTKEAARTIEAQDSAAAIEVSFLDGVERVRSRAFIPEREMFVSVESGLAEFLAQAEIRKNVLLAIQLIFSVFVLVLVVFLRQTILSRESMIQELDTFFSSALDLLCIANTDGTFIRVNKEWEKTLGYRAEDLENRSFLDLVHPDDLALTLAAVERLKSQDAILSFSNRYRCKDGSYRHFEWRSAPRGTRIYAAARDITERIRTETALRENESRLRAISESAQDAIVMMDPQGKIAFWNPAAERIFRYSREEALGADLHQLIAPQAFHAPYQAAFAAFKNSGQGNAINKTLELQAKRKTGEDIAVELALSAIQQEDGWHSVGLIRDITERREAQAERTRLEGQLQQAMKMEAIGRLAGGVAHDFNNQLTAIGGFVSLVLLKLPPDDPLTEMLLLVQKAADSSAVLTRQLLAFSRKQLIEPRVLDLNEVTASLQTMLARLIGENIVLRTLHGAGLGAVKIDPGQMEQILVNLVVNARDAMPGGGTVLIETSNVELDEEYCRRHPYVQPGHFVMLAISDTGQGMSAAVKAHLFEPFFTTKPKGRGTGLGLATIYGAVKQANGSIEVYSEEGRGTSFKIYLPRVVEKAQQLAVLAPAPQMPGGGETILLVEDEEIVRGLALQILTPLGYTVLAAADGGQALALVEGYPARIDLLLTDVVMPGLNGRELAERLLAIHPETLVLYTSGYTENAIAHHGVIDQGLNFIGKPYTPQALARKLRETLDRGKV